jgi:hypothetical protein
MTSSTSVTAAPNVLLPESIALQYAEDEETRALLRDLDEALSEQINEALRTGDARKAVTLGGSTWGAEVLYQAWTLGLIDVAQLGPALAHAWVMSHAPRFLVNQATWARLFRAAGYVTDEADLPLPTEPITVFRGASIHDRGRGMAWTEDVGVAITFAQTGARRSGTIGRVFRSIVPPRHVLARFGSRKEAEVVVSPSWLARWAEPSLVIEAVPPLGKPRAP